MDVLGQSNRETSKPVKNSNTEGKIRHCLTFFFNTDYNMALESLSKYFCRQVRKVIFCKSLEKLKMNAITISFHTCIMSPICLGKVELIRGPLNGSLVKQKACD